MESISGKAYQGGFCIAGVVCGFLGIQNWGFREPGSDLIPCPVVNGGIFWSSEYSAVCFGSVCSLQTQECTTDLDCAVEGVQAIPFFVKIMTHDNDQNEIPDHLVTK